MMGEGGVGVTLRHAQGDHGELVEPSPSPPSPPAKGGEFYGEGGDITSLDGGSSKRGSSLSFQS